MRALNEVAAITRKAAIGAGIPPAQAQDLAQTAVFMAGRGEDMGPVLAALAEPDVAIDVAWGGTRLIIKAGTAAMTAPMVKDGFCMGLTKVRLFDPAHAALTCAMLAEAGIKVACQNCVLDYMGRTTPEHPLGPVDVPDQVWAVLAEYAARTYVPETEASRNSGAGAGLTDND